MVILFDVLVVLFLMEMGCAVQVQAGQQREHIGLDRGDHQFQHGDAEHGQERHPTEEDAEGDDETRQHFQENVAGQHVGEKT